MQTRVDLLTTPEMDKTLFALAKANGTTYRRELSRTLDRAADSMDRLLLALYAALALQCCKAADKLDAAQPKYHVEVIDHEQSQKTA